MIIYPAGLASAPADGIPVTDAHTHNMQAGPGAIINLGPGEYAVPRTDRLYSVGLHPWDTATCQGACADAAMQHIARAARIGNVVAIGECGLDTLRGAPMKEQERIFRMHIALSEELRKPLIIHSVRSLQPLIRLRRLSGAKQRWIVHGFRGSVAKAQALVDAGIDISIGTIHAPGLEQIVPEGHLWHETDMDF